jgi:hypothetical protein
VKKVAKLRELPKVTMLLQMKQYNTIKLSGTKLTGQTIDLSQFNKPKKKKEEPKLLLINQVLQVLLVPQIKIKKRINSTGHLGRVQI